MTCDNGNGKLDYLGNNNNVTTKNELKSNGVKMNGTAKLPVEEEVETRKSIIILLSIFATSLVAMVYIWKNFPELEE